MLKNKTELTPIDENDKKLVLEAMRLLSRQYRMWLVPVAGSHNIDNLMRRAEAVTDDIEKGKITLMKIKK